MLSSAVEGHDGKMDSWGAGITEALSFFLFDRALSETNDGELNSGFKVSMSFSEWLFTITEGRAILAVERAGEELTLASWER
jgi:hypothetical protein